MSGESLLELRQELVSLRRRVDELESQTTEFLIHPGGGGAGTIFHVVVLKSELPDLDSSQDGKAFGYATDTHRLYARIDGAWVSISHLE